jgi:hypothetical protein
MRALMGAKQYHEVLRHTTDQELEVPLQNTGHSPKWLEFAGWYVAALLLLLLIIAVDGWTRERDIRNHLEQELHDCVRGWATV